MASDWPLVSASVLACLANTNNCVSESDIRQKLKFRFGSQAAIARSHTLTSASHQKAATQQS